MTSLYTNLLTGPTTEQLLAIRERQERQTEYIETVRAYRIEHGTDMPLSEAERLYQSITERS